MLAQHLVDQVRIHRHLAPVLLRAGLVALDQPGDHRDVAERAPQHRAFRHPGLQIVAQHVGLEQARDIERLERTPHRQHIIRRHEPERMEAEALHPPCEQHAEGLVRVATLEAVGDGEELVAARKRLDQQVIAARHARDVALKAEPLLHLIRKGAPGCRVLQHAAHPIGQIGRHRHAAAGIGRHLGLPAAAIGDLADRLLQAQELQHSSRENEGVARTQHVDEILLHLAQRRAPPAGVANLQQRFLDDGADVHAVLAGDTFAHDMHQSGAVAEQAAVAVIGGQRVAAILDEAEHVVEILPFQHAVRLHAPDLVIQRIGPERAGTGDAHDVLGEDIEPAGARRIAIQLAGPDPGDGGLAFQHLEAVGRHQDGAGDLVHAVIGAADALQQARDPLGRADLEHLVDPAPIDAEIERGRGDHRAQQALGHRRLHPLALVELQRAVMDRNRQGLVVEPPQCLEQ